MQVTFRISEDQVEVEILERVAIRHGPFQASGDLPFVNAHEVPSISENDFRALNVLREKPLQRRR